MKKKDDQLVVRWPAEVKHAFERLAAESFRMKPSDLARTVIEVFMSRFLAPEEVARLELVTLNDMELRHRAFRDIGNGSTEVPLRTVPIGPTMSVEASHVKPRYRKTPERD